MTMMGIVNPAARIDWIKPSPGLGSRRSVDHHVGSIQHIHHRRRLCVLELLDFVTGLSQKLTQSSTGCEVIFNNDDQGHGDPKRSFWGFAAQQGTICL